MKMYRRKIMSAILSIVMLMNIFQGFTMIYAEDNTNDIANEWKNYTVFSANKNTGLSMSCWKSTINGNVYTGQNFIFNGSELYLNGTCSSVGNITTNGWLMNIDSRQPNAKKIETPQIGEEIRQKALSSSENYCTDKNFSANEINLYDPIISDGDITFNGTTFSGEGYIIAKDTITYNVSWLNTGDEYYSVLYSENGDIIINGSSVTVNGILYAPNGKVQFNVSELTLNGRIIADNIVFSGSQFNISGSDDDWNIIENESPIISKTYTLSDDFSTGSCTNVNSENDMLTLAKSTETENTQFAKEYYKDDNVGNGVKVNQSYDKTTLKSGENVVNVKYALSGFGEAAKEENAVDLAIVVDRSYSMDDGSYDNSKTAIKEIVNGMKDADRCALITYAGRTLIDVQCGFESDKEKIKETVDKFPGLGSATATFSALTKANELFEQESEANRQKVIILLSDGEDNSSPSSAYEITKTLKENNIRVYAIGIGSLLDREEMEQIAIDSNGIYMNSPTANEIGEIMNYMAAEVFNVAGRQVKLQKKVAAGVVLDSINPEPTEIIDNNDGTKTISWLYDKILMDEIKEINISAKISEESKVWCDIFTDTYLLFYDKEGNPLITYLDDIVMPISDVVNRGKWTVTYDSGAKGINWKNIYWNGKLINDSSVNVYAAVSEDNEVYTSPIKINNNAQLSELCGRYIKLDVELIASIDGKSPEIYDITVINDKCENIVMENQIPQLELKDTLITKVNKYIKIIPQVTDDVLANNELTFEWLCDDINAEIKDVNSCVTGAVFTKIGKYALKLKVSDGEKYVEEIINITVEPNEDFDKIEAEIKEGLSVQLVFPENGVDPNENNIIKVVTKGGNGTVWSSVKLNGKYVDLNENNEFLYKPDNVCTFTIDASAYDTSGGSEHISETYRTNGEDDISPSVTLNVSSSNVIITKPVTITSYATDYVGIKSYSVTVNGEEITLDSNNKYTFTPTELGTYTIIAAAEDEAGNITTKTKTVEVVKDYINPSARLYISSYTAAVGETVTLTAYGNDNIAVDRMELLVNGEKEELDSGNKYYYKTNELGEVTFILNVYDAEGNVGTSTTVLKVTTDMTAPKLSIYNIYSFVEGSSGQIIVTATDNIGVTEIKVYANGELLLPDDDGKYTLTCEKAGTITVTAYAYDAEGNEGKLTKTFTVQPDTLTPSIRISCPSSTTVGKNVTGTIIATDNVGVASLDVYIDDVKIELDENNTFEYMTTHSGTCTIKAIAYDKAGNSKTATHTFTVYDDTYKPNVYLYTNRSSAYIGNKIVVTAYATDNVEVVRFKVDINGEEITLTDENTYTFFASEAGTYTITATATDKSGNVTAKTENITVTGDTIAPSVSCSVLPGSTLYIGQTATIKVDITDNVAVKEYKVLLNNEEITLDENNCYNLKIKEAGEIALLITASDTSGNERTYTKKLTAKPDTTAPTVNLTVDKDTINKGESILLGLTASDNVAVIKIEADYNGAAIEFDENSALITPEKSGKITVKVYDDAGNVTTAEKNITVKSATSNPDIPDGDVDYSKPIVNITANYTGEECIYVPINKDIVVYINAEDNISVEKIYAELNGEEVELNDNNSFSFTSDKSAVYTVTAKAYDAAGNIGYAQQKFFAVTEAASDVPKVEITSPDDGENLSNTVKITGTVSDSDLVRYELSYSESGKENYTVFANGGSSVENGELGTLDTTLLNNGVYDIRLTAYDAAGNSVKAMKTYVVSGNLKLGNFSISFDDMTIPVNGLPLTVTRTYDSRSRNTVGDFGYGWDMTLSNIKVEVTTDIGTNWYQMSDETELTPTYMINEYRPHKVIVTYPNGDTDKFKITTNPSRKTITPILDAQLSITAEEGTSSKLEFADDTETYFAQSGTDINFLDSSSMEIYNPKRFVLTTKEGVKYLLDTDKGVEKIINLDGTTLTFTDSGIEHSDGKSIVFERDSENRITSITDPMGNSVKYGYDQYGDLAAVADRENNVVRFTYDENHYLKDIISANGVRVGRNEYDENGRLTATIDADGNRIEYTHNTDEQCEIVKDRLGNQTVYYYDADGNVTKKVDAYGNETEYTYDENGNKLTETNALGDITFYEYDSRSNMISLKNAAGIETKLDYDSNGRVLEVKDISKDIVKFAYDDNGNITSSTDANGNQTEYSYDDHYRLSGISDNIGKLMTITYDKNGNMATMKDAGGRTVSFSYDENGRCTSRTIITETAAGTKTLTEAYGYDANGNITSVIDCAGNRSTVEYNEFGKVAVRTDANQNRTEYSYDEFGNLVKVLYPDNTTELFEYDAEGQNIASIGRNGVKVKYEYDKLKRPVKTIYPNGSFDSVVYDAVGRAVQEIGANGGVTVYEYDSIGRNTSVTDACGNVTRYIYDDSSMMIESIDPKGNHYKMEYDLNGNRTKLILPDDTFTQTVYDERGRVTKVIDPMLYETVYEYDNSDNIIKVTTQDGIKWNYEYDLQNNLTAVIDPNGNTTKYEYDDFSRPVKMTLPLGMSKTISYDKLGNVEKTTDFNGNTVIYSYDNMNRMTAKTYSDGSSVCYKYSGGKTESVTDANGTIRYVYNDMGMLDSKVLYDGTVVDYDYDTSGNISKITTPYSQTQYEYDLMDRIIRIIDKDGCATLYEYDANGNRTAVRHANGMVTTYEYDSLNRLILETIKDSEGNTAQWYKYTLDAAGNRTQAEEYTGAVTEYEYDCCYRLVKEKTIDEDTVKMIQYSYDDMYNRISKNEDGVITEYEYDANNRLIKDGAQTLEYDNNGNLIRSIGTDTEKTYIYNQDNRLIKAVIVNATDVITEEYVYDCEGNRISKAANETDITKYIVDTNCEYARVLAELNADCNVKCVYTYGDEIISQKRGDVISIYLADGHGNVRMLADMGGNITDTYDYDAFGNLTNRTGETENNYLYCGEQYDNTTGYYYLRARYMNPKSGTFISMDSYSGSIADPVSLHKYLYANANPVMNIDPTGNYSVAMTQTCVAMAAMLSTVVINVHLKRAQELLHSAQGEIIGTSMCDLSNDVQEILMYVGGWAYYEMLVNEVFQTYSAAFDFTRKYAKEIIEYVEKTEYKNSGEGGDTSVYIMRDKKRKKKVVYVGISNDTERRKYQHKNDIKHPERVNWVMTVVFTGLKRHTARAMEQTLISAYTLEALDNARNEIAQKNYDKFKDEIRRVGSLLKLPI